MKRLLIVVLAAAGLCLPYTFFPDNPTWFTLDASWAAPGNSGNGGNNGNGGGIGNPSGVGGGNGGQGNGGQGGNGGGGNNGGGNTGGGQGGGVSAPTAPSPSRGSAPVAAPSVSGESAGALTQGYAQDQTGPMGGGATVGTLTASQARTEEATRVALQRAGHHGLVQVERINANGSFTYSGYEWALAAFAREMKALGYNMGVLGEASTDFAGTTTTDLYQF